MNGRFRPRMAGPFVLVLAGVAVALMAWAGHSDQKNRPRRTVVTPADLVALAAVAALLSTAAAFALIAPAQAAESPAIGWFCTLMVHRLVWASIATLAGWLVHLAGRRVTVW